MTPRESKSNSLRVRGLGKAYRRYPRKSGRLAEWLGFGRQHDLRWAVRNISFDLSPGEAFGVIGANGSGKSTLLKMISGTTRPTTGSVQYQGDLSALLELGLGFDPDFTGRQNAVMAASLRGMSADDLGRHMTAIEEFAGIGDFIDQPVRTYSSGMHVRLAFSVATATRPDILILDEALSVGDRYFSHKSMTRIREYVEEGMALLFVSHDMTSVKTLCRRALLLHEGEMVEMGEASRVVDTYVGSVLREQSRRALRVMPPPAALQPVESFPQGFESTHTQIDSGDASIDDFVIRAEDGRPVRHVSSGQVVTFEYTVHTNRTLDDPHFGISIRTRHGISVFNTNSYAMGRRNSPLESGSSARIAFRVPLPLAPDHYGICIGLANRGYGESSFEEYLNNTINIDVIQVLPTEGGATFGGLVNLQPEYAVVKAG